MNFKTAKLNLAKTQKYPNSTDQSSGRFSNYEGGCPRFVNGVGPNIKESWISTEILVQYRAVI